MVHLMVELKVESSGSQVGSTLSLARDDWLWLSPQVVHLYSCPNTPSYHHSLSHMCENHQLPMMSDTPELLPLGLLQLEQSYQQSYHLLAHLDHYIPNTSLSYHSEEWRMYGTVPLSPLSQAFLIQGLHLLAPALQLLQIQFC